MYQPFGAILIFVIVAVLFVLGSLLVGWILRKQDPYPQKESTYECGEEAIGTAWIQFNVRFYVVALIFIVFAVEVVVLFPFVVIFKEPGTWGTLAKMMIFVGLLVAGLVYDWAKGDLEWPKSLTMESKSPEDRG